MPVSSFPTAPTYESLYQQLLPQYQRRETYTRGAPNVPDWIYEGGYQSDANGNYWMDSVDSSGINAAINDQLASYGRQTQAAAAAANPSAVHAPVSDEVRNYYQNFKNGDNPYFTDSQNHQWYATDENGVFSGAAKSGAQGGGNYGFGDIDGYVRGDEVGRKANDGSMVGYYDRNGVWSASKLNDPGMSSGMMFLTALTAAVGGAAYGAAASAGTGAAAGAGAGAAGAGTAAGVGSGAFLGEGVASGIGAWDAAAGLGTAAGAGGAGAAGAAAGGGGGGLGTGSGAFLGEGAASGIPAWDGALANAAAGGAAAPVAGSAGGGTPPPANPYNAGSYLSAENLSNLAASGDYSSLLGSAASLAGGLLGSQGQSAESSSTRAMDPRMDALFYGDLAPRAQGLLASQMPQARAVGNQLLTQGSAMLGQTAPTTATNPYLKGITDDMARRTGDLLGANNLQIQGNSVASGGLGGSRQGVAQGMAASKAADSLQGNIATLYGTAYQGDQNRLLQQQTLGAGLLSQGLSAPWAPIQQTAQTYSPFTGTGTTTNNTSSGGGWQGVAGGALGAAQFGKSMGWW